ncbi:MAG: hypothetical protein GY941_27290, partial [Planctomycetes bacterium]|nr:hypothetical protein [Planctomycetota bacterium]
MNPSLINGFSNAFSDASFSWFEALYPIAQRLFLLLATIELTWSGIWWALAARQDSVLVPLLRKVVSLMFFYTVLLLAPQWIPMVIRSFITAGQTASGFQGLAPASVFAQGIDVAVGMFTKIGSLMALLGAAAWLIVAPFVVVICFALISAMMTLTLVESYFVIGGGVLLLGFAGSRWTATF